MGARNVQCSGPGRLLSGRPAGRGREPRVIVDRALELNPNPEEAKGLAQLRMVLLTD